MEACDIIEFLLDPTGAVVKLSFEINEAWDLIELLFNMLGAVKKLPLETTEACDLIEFLVPNEAVKKLVSEDIDVCDLIEVLLDPIDAVGMLSLSVKALDRRGPDLGAGPREIKLDGVAIGG